jgi:hypothetical protein
VRVFEDDLEFGGRRARGGLFGHAHGRNAHHVAGGETVQLIDTAFVDPHFARAQDAVDVAFRHALANAQQVVVDALAGFFFGDGDELGLRLNGGVEGGTTSFCIFICYVFPEISLSPSF